MKTSSLARNLTIWILFFFLLFIIAQKFQEGDNRPPAEWQYSKFISQVKTGAIAKVSIEERQIEGSTKNGVDFITHSPLSHDSLTDTLLAHGVEIDVKPEKKDSWWTRLLLMWLPFGILIIFLVMMMRQAQSGGSSAMSFGKSRAKLAGQRPGRITFKDVAGVDEAKEELREVIDFLKNPKKFERLGGKIPKGVLLLGAPGTGKTLLAKAVAGEAGRPFYSISGSDFVEMFVGVGASRVRDLFEQGKKNAPCIIFIDEIDAVGRHRGAGLGGGHDEREQTLNQLLVEMDGFATHSGVILIAATNRPDVLDPALLRPGRFDRQVVVDLPDLNGREAILKLHSAKVPLAEQTKLRVIAQRTPGFSGADLANVINEAALLASRRDRKAVTMDELEEAIDRVTAGPERRSRVISEAEKKIVAYHEAGHALVGKMIPSANRVHKISIIPRGHSALGYTLQLPTEDRFLATEQEILNEICIFLGGRASEEIVFGEISTGAQNDLERASEAARKMVTRYGMSKKLGAGTFGRQQEQVFLGRDYSRERNYSESTAKIIDSEVRRIVGSCYERAMKLLRQKRDKLVVLAETVLKKEILEAEEIDTIVNGRRGKQNVAKRQAKSLAEGKAAKRPGTKTARRKGTRKATKGAAKR